MTLKSKLLFCAQKAYLSSMPHPTEVLQSYRCPTYIVQRSHRLLSTAGVAEQKTSSQNEDGLLMSAKPFSEIPTMKKIPFFGSTFEFGKHKDFDILHFDRMLKSLNEEYGPIFVIHLLPFIPKIVFLSNPDDYETYLRATVKNPIRNAFNALKKVRYSSPGNYFENKGGLLPENNDEWWRVRSRVQTPMMKQKNISRYLQEMDNVTLEFVHRIAQLQSEHGEMPPTFQEEIYKWALESVGVVALNKRLGCLDPDLKDDSTQMQMIRAANNIFDAMHKCEMGSQLWRLFPTAEYKRLRKGHQTFLEIADASIYEAEENIKTKRNLDSDSDPELTLMETLLTVPGLSRKDVVTLMIDMLMAGIDTTSHVVAFTLYLLAKNPNVQAKLQEEVDQVLGDGKDSLTDNHLAQLSYLKLCVKESLRIFPIFLGTTRVLDKDLVLSGYRVPKGCQVVGLNFLSCRSDSIFTRSAEYIPERWHRSQPLGPIHPFASLPFSHGTRMCIGRRIAELELYTVLARIFHRFTVEYHHADMGFECRLSSVPSEPLRFQFRERSK